MLDKTYRPAEVEAKFYAIWEKSGAFACDPASPAQPFTIVMPPPNVTGSLHIGHALNTTVQDILIRYWRMRGRDALWQPGTITPASRRRWSSQRQLALEQTNRHQLGRAKFIERVWSWKAESGGTITASCAASAPRAIGARERFTMDEALGAVRKVFVTLYKEG